MAKHSAEKRSEAQLVRLFGEKRGTRLSNQLREAGTLFGSERYLDAQRLLAPITQQAPEVAEARELYGLVLYRLGKWHKAIRELEAFSSLAGGSTEQHPVICDCYRALGLGEKVEETWEEFRVSAPTGDLAAEGRIVYSSALADQGKFAEAIALLENDWLPIGKANAGTTVDTNVGKGTTADSTGSDSSAKADKGKHQKAQCSPETSLRLVYMLGDLYDRSGEIPRATALFQWIADRDHDFADVADRLHELSG